VLRAILPLAFIRLGQEFVASLGEVVQEPVAAR
jgi:hypothetical protein